LDLGLLQTKEDYLTLSWEFLIKGNPGESESSLSADSMLRLHFSQRSANANGDRLLGQTTFGWTSKYALCT